MPSYRQHQRSAGACQCNQRNGNVVSNVSVCQYRNIVATAALGAYVAATSMYVWQPMTNSGVASAANIGKSVTMACVAALS